MISRESQRRLGAALFVVLAILGLVSMSWVLRYGWAIHKLTRGVGDMTFYDRDGKPWFRMDEERRDVPLAKIAPDLQHAVVAVEDHRFYRHPGIDPLALGRAVVRDVTGGGMVEGGSTLTQQLVKNFFLTPERSIKRKLTEAMMALLLEKRLNKKEIMEMYLNEIYMGQRGGLSINGVGEASRLLFRKDVRHIDVQESALLAGIIQAPNACADLRF